MLEYWYKERRTLVDFRRGPLGPHFDGLSAYLKEKQYSPSAARHILSRSCLFNDYLTELGVTNCRDISEVLVDEFLDEYLKGYRTTSHYRSKRATCRGALTRLLNYLRSIGVISDRNQHPVPDAYRWIMNPYLRHLQQGGQTSETTIQRKCVIACDFLEALGDSANRVGMKAMQPEMVERFLVKHMEVSPENRKTLASGLRGFLRFCAEKKYTRCDLSNVVPSMPTYRHASLPRGMDESELQRMLDAVPAETGIGARDYAIMLLMMAYGIRGTSVAALLLEDIDWHRSTLCIRARKGGKEVILPLFEAVGEAVVRYLRHRPTTTLRELFVTTRAPVNPLKGQMISAMIHKYMDKAGVQKARGGSGMLRHSWAIRALAHDSPMKAIADVLGHRCLDTTFIYAKADLKMLRQVTMPWPEGG